MAPFPHSFCVDYMMGRNILSPAVGWGHTSVLWPFSNYQKAGSLRIDYNDLALTVRSHS